MREMPLILCGSDVNGNIEVDKMQGNDAVDKLIRKKKNVCCEAK